MKLRIRDPAIIDPFLRSLFQGEPGGTVDVAEFLRELLPPAANFSVAHLLGQSGADLASLISDAASVDVEWQRSEVDANGYQVASLTRADRAIQILRMKNTGVTSNVLHLIAAREDSTFWVSRGEGRDLVEVSFASQRAKAKAGLATRGNPPYDPSAYQTG